MTNFEPFWAFIPIPKAFNIQPQAGFAVPIAHLVGTLLPACPTQKQASGLLKVQGDSLSHLQVKHPLVVLAEDAGRTGPPGTPRDSCRCRSVEGFCPSRGI
jgi:hypothetical protein